MHNVFVYGTLRKGEGNHGLIADAACLAMTASIKGVLIDTGLGYPGLLEGEGEVAGELYVVSDRHLERLDELEEYFGEGDEENEYDRVEVEVRTDGGSTRAWAYYYKKAGYGDAAAGSYPSFPDWKAYRMRG
ncbi:gamma-glutamylcyclotransferase family protein [Paenibacillus arenilitoris]|uniref:Gamma-glutamylcyclotransferase family protein n=1 Tax=Paenibacillus arenilitoris TaxID=2772299 RepID=A0A927CU56_9BACL|nr:gamma-glutamylcyclotransferase [Paenibacillus arenilitoris]MBD2871916.1 gamma-glutamylcyclotransferase [Paenibacillus arenilitoris]